MCIRDRDKDLKIQIVNQKTGKVITGTAFEVTVTDSAKKTESYTDKDKDGIIYVKSMKPGKCTVSMKASGGYSVPTDITADVKANIEYKAVDVSAEIKLSLIHIFTTEEGWYVIQHVSDLDEDATADRLEELKESAKQDVYKRQALRTVTTDGPQESTEMIN